MAEFEKEITGERTLQLGGLLLAVVFAGTALAFGGVLPIAYACMEAGIVLAAILTFWRGWSPLPRPALFVIGVLVAVPLLQLVPLPLALASLVSPNRGAFTDRLFSSFSSPPGYQPFSLNPHATEVALLKLIAYVLAFLIAYRLAVKERREIFLRTLLIVAVFEACYGLVQYLADWPYVLTYRATGANASGTYINRNHFAGLLEMVGPFVLAAILFRPKRRAEPGIKRRVISIISSPGTFKVLSQAVLFAVLCLGLFFSCSRSGIVAGLTGLLLVASLYFLRHRRGSVLGLLLLVLLIPASYALWIGTEAVISRFETLGRVGALEENRLPVWRDSLRAVGDFRWAGTGLGTYESVCAHYQTAFLNSQYEHAHNDYLEFATELGVPATVLLFGSLWVLVVVAARAAIALDNREDRILAAGAAGALAAILLHSITDFNLQIPANALLFCWVAGTASGVSCRLDGRRVFNLARMGTSLTGSNDSA